MSIPTGKTSSTGLSKSRFNAGVQCLKRLYLQVHHPELAPLPDEPTLATLQQGREVGEMARRAFHGGALVEASEGDLTASINKTANLVGDPDVHAIFEGTFKYDNIVVRTDILERKLGGWRLIEVKSSSGMKEQYPYDVGIQQYVLNSNGLDTFPWLMHLNRDYIYDGHYYDLDRLFVIRSLEQEVEKLKDELPALIQKQREALSKSVPPFIEPGPQCTDPVRCEFYDYCNLPLPEDHVALLPGISSAKLRQLMEKGISSIHDIPADFELSERQRHACQCVQTQEPYIAENLKADLDLLVYPLFFADFETISPPIPRYAGMRPFDHVPFQWSIHTRRRPGGVLEHYEFLAEDGRDPRLAFLTSLLEALGSEGHIVVYNRTFESQRLADLARWLPEYESSIAQVQSRLWDLLDVVRKHVYHPRFRGSFSLKSVLPALIPDMTYEGMEVSHGEEAGLAWEKLFRGRLSQAEKLRLRIALLEYCGQDTLAMVRLLDYFLNASPSIS